MTGISVVVAARDEAEMLPGCLRRLTFADEIVVVVDDRTTDNSAVIAEAAGAKVIHHTFDGFAGLKNAGLNAVQHEWTLIVDADERVGPSLADEISSVTDQDVEGFLIPRVNYFYGHKIRFGGWRERHVRLIRSGSAHYVGALHEVLEFNRRDPRIARLQSPLHHFTHRSVIDNLHKTASYAEVQAQSDLQAGAPPVRTARLYWVTIREIAYRLIWKQGWRDGIPGTIECLYQPLSVLAVKARLWEAQQNPSIGELYKRLEDEIE